MFKICKNGINQGFEAFNTVKKAEDFLYEWFTQINDVDTDFTEFSAKFDIVEFS